MEQRLNGQRDWDVSIRFLDVVSSGMFLNFCFPLIGFPLKWPSLWPSHVVRYSNVDEINGLGASGTNGKVRVPTR